MQSFYAHGKLLLTGEYTVLDGAAALAIPTRQGQHLHVSSLAANPLQNTDYAPFWQGYRRNTEPVEVGKANLKEALRWTSYDCHGSVWLDLLWQPLTELAPQVFTGEASVAERLIQILQSAILLRGGDAQPLLGQQLSSHLTFERQWGLGSSSTLIHCLATWLQVDPFALLAATFGGSGYDLACAAATGPIRFQRLAGQPTWEPLDWSPNWLNHTHFLYLNQKQNSREGIAHYRRQSVQPTDIARITEYTDRLIGAKHLRLPATLAPASEAAAQQNTDPVRDPRPAKAEKQHPRPDQPIATFDELLDLLHKHEQFTGQLTQQPTVQARLFPDFPGQLKSLGAWGGDFVWVLSPLPAEDCRAYFQKRGYETLLPWSALASTK